MRPIRAYRSWSAHRRLAVGVLAVAGALVLLALVDLARIGIDLVRGRNAVADLDITSVEDIDIGDLAADAAGRLDRAHRRAEDSPWLGLFGHLPVVGGQVAGIREMTGTAAELGEVAGASAARIDLALDNAGDGAGRLALTETVSAELETIDDAVRATQVTDRRLLWPLDAIRDDLVEELAETRGELADASRRVGAIDRMLRGPGDYLVLAANNAEMSGGVGMPLSAGVLHIEGGELDLGEFIQSSDLLPADGRALRVDPVYKRLYGGQGFGYDFRGTTGSPNFAAIGDLLARMSARVDTGPVDGVFLVDTVAVAGLVHLTGPIEVEGRTLDGDQVLFELLSGNYERYGTLDVREERVDLQGQFADATFDALTTRDIDPADLVSALFTLTEGRHVLAWSPDPDLQDVWESSSADGALGSDSLLVAVINLDANKIDAHVQPSVHIETSKGTGGWTRVDLTVTVPNPPLPDSVAYVIGSTPEHYRNQIGVYLPGHARDIEIVEDTGPGEFNARGRNGDSWAIISLGYAPRNGERRFALTFEVPPSLDELEILSSARAFGSLYDVNGEQFPDTKPTTVSIAPPGSGGSSRTVTAASSLVLALLTGGAGLLLVRRGRLRPQLPRWLVDPPRPVDAPRVSS